MVKYEAVDGQRDTTIPGFGSTRKTTLLKQDQKMQVMGGKGIFKGKITKADFQTLKGEK